MIATLVIGLREGLEAALIVGIIAAFLRKNGRSLVPMWIGVFVAVLLSVGVGVALKLIERELPQSEQEALETVIGVVAIVFVTGMIVWMNTHSRGMKKELEAEAAEALSQGGARSLAVMAFLAVLKEGFETSVFLLATFSAAQSATLAASGAVIGVLIAAAIGWGIYAGGVKINLAKFFRFTGAFLILVAAGLTLAMLRTAHEAGWIVAGQQRTIDLSWLVKPGTVQSALITGVLGIPSDPRLIEVLGWFAYLVPVALYVYWPKRYRPQGTAVARVQFAIAAVLAIAAAGLAWGYPTPATPNSDNITLVAREDDAQTPIGLTHLVSTSDGYALVVALDGAEETTIPLTADGAATELHSGVSAQTWTSQRTIDTTTEPLTLNDLVEINGGRVPIGIDRQRNPGPFDVEESTVVTDTVWIANGALLDASESTTTIAKISGSGLTSARTITVSDDDAAATGWTISAEARSDLAVAIADHEMSETERELWAEQLPLLLLLLAAVCAVAGVRSLVHHRRNCRRTPDSTAPPLESRVSAA